MKQLMERMKKKGVTLTPQRLAVMDYLKKSVNHPSVDEIYTAIKIKYPSISTATVYSTLQLLKELGEIQELHIKGEKAVFDPIAENHHHLLCRECGSIINVTVNCPIIKKKKIDGHVIEEVQAYLYGVCADCLNKKPKNS